MAMYTYISSYSGFRSKGSFSFSEFYYSNDRTECSSSWVSPFLIHGFSVNPRILYGLRQSTLLQWPAYRRLIWGGNCGNGCCPSAATVGICGTSRGNRMFCSLEERRRERRVACSSWERKGYDSISDGSVDEMINLLTDVISRESVGVRESDSRSAAKSGRKMRIQRDDVCEIEKEVRVDECSEREEKHEGHDSWESSLRGEVVIKSGKGFKQRTRKDSSRDDKHKSRKIDWGSRQENQYVELDCGERMSRGEVIIKSEAEGYRHPRREEYLRDNFHKERKDTSSSSYYSMESSGDLGSNMEESLQSNPERVVGESLSVSKNDLGWDRKDLSVEEVRQHNEYGSNMRYSESSTKRNSETQSIICQDRVRSDVMEVDFDQDLVEPLGKHYEVLGSHKSVSKSENHSKMRMEDMEESLTSSSKLVHGAREQYVENDKQVVGKIETRIGTKKLNTTSEMHVYDSRTASSSQSISDSRVNSREENTTSNMNLSEETRRQRSSTDYQVSGKTELRKGSDILTEVFEIHDTDANHTFRRQTEDNSPSVLNSVQQAREQRNQNNQKDLAQIELSKESQRHSNVLEIHITDAEGVKNFQRFSKKRISEQEKNASSVLNQIQEAREQHHQTNEKVIRQHGSRKDSRNHTTRQEYHGDDVEMASSSSQTLVNVRVKAHEDSSMLVLQSVEEPRKQQIGASDVVSRKPLVMVTPPQSQLVVRGPQAHAAQSDENLESGSVAAYQQGKNSATIEELDSRIQRDEMYEGGALESSSRLDNSSAQFVGEFVDMLRKEISASDKLSMASRCSSEIRKESISSATASVTQDEKHKQQSPKRISTGSRTKGPSDDMWDVAGPSSLEASEIEAPKKGSSVDGVMEANVQTDTGNVTARRSSRSLWSYIADMVRKGWGSRAESHTPTIKSGARSSSNESLNSESWFSGDEPEGDHDENAKKSKSGILKEPLLITETQHASESMRSQEKLTQIKSDASTSMDLLETSSPFKSASSVSGKVDFERIEGEMERQNIPSMVGSIDPSFPLTGTSTSSSRHRIPASDRGEISETGKAQISRSGVAELDEEPVGEGATETTGTEGKDGQLKRRKLRRNKQVIREHFDEWEEAFRLEQEQRKTDEMFMREALSEAKKAGDSWEVPVGAVLVQNGKIIARGYNLVEELRDSTAHAEMICIREASNLLRTWRLAETTLYVTLEPCPMCAGAILQARIDTVVWGAPNKLLGADGSWVSLFPGGEEGGNVSDRLPGPVHPFHPKITIRRGILATECADVMQQFFQLRRRKNKKSEPSPHLPVSNHPSKFFSKLHHMFDLMFCL